MTEFKITGTGEYRTQGGDKVTITGLNRSPAYPFIGYFEKLPHQKFMWSSRGYYYYSNRTNCLCTYDIIGPWVEPAVDKSLSTDHDKLILSLELAAHHNECAELLLDAAQAIRELSEAAK